MANDRTTTLRMELDGQPSARSTSVGHSRRHAQPADTIRRELERSLLYSEELGIDLAKRSDAVYFRWFLASLLFGARTGLFNALDAVRPERVSERA